MSLLLLVALTCVLGPASAEDEPTTTAGQDPRAVLETPQPDRASSVDPFEGEPHRPVPADGVSPLEEGGPPDDEVTTESPPAASSPLDPQTPPGSDTSMPARAPVSTSRGPAPEELDPRKTLLARLDLMFGPFWRIDTTDIMVSTSIEVGRMSGFSGTFHTEMLVSMDRDVVRAFDFPIGVGAVARGRLRKKPLYGSIGLTAGILVHRAATDEGVTRRVDPDFRLPIRFAWTLHGVGTSLAIVQGYSVRSRTYERRGAELWHRSAYRIALLIGVHLDIIPDRVAGRRSKRRRAKR